MIIVLKRGKINIMMLIMLYLQKIIKHSIYIYLYITYILTIYMHLPY